MLKFEYAIPTIYASIISFIIMKEHMFDLGMNIVTWSIYLANLFVVYILSLLGRKIDKCLDYWL